MAKTDVTDIFNPFEVDLEGSNLIEASAGTGKTFSIAVLTLRLILYKDVSIKDVLMVTFTNAAAAEMELRIRDFLHDALSVAEGKQEGVKEEIIELVKNAGEISQTIQRLKMAIQQMDQSSILTIHSFCAKMLSEFAFESGHFFSATALHPDENTYLQMQVINEFWREDIATLDQDILYVLRNAGFSRKLFLSIIKSAIGGKKVYHGLSEDGRNAEELLQACILALKNWIAQDMRIDVGLLKAEKEAAVAELRSHIEDEWTVLKNLSGSYKGKGASDVSKKLKPLFDADEKDEIINKLLTNTSQFITHFFPAETYDKVKIIFAAEEEIKKAIKEKKSLSASKLSGAYRIIALLATVAAQKVENETNKMKSESGALSFDDMISYLHAALHSDSRDELLSQRLIRELRKRYSAVFIDEFQDTDKLQFDIFHRLFQSDELPERPILFYIGDPKQSIYAFRKADLATYFKAGKSVDKVHRMNTNFRSTDRYIKAMNQFFIPRDGFDVFKYPDMHYHPVSSPAQQLKTGGLIFGEQELDPMRIAYYINTDIVQGAANLIYRMIQDNRFRLDKNGTKDRIQPKNIGLLVRDNSEARKMKEALAKLSIPAITIDDAKVLQSKEAKEILYILEAVIQIERGKIHRALITRIGGYALKDLSLIDEDAMLHRFRIYQELWKKDGVYVLLRTIFSDLALISRMYEASSSAFGERLLANAFQIMEMLHKKEVSKKYVPDELIFWLTKGVQGENNTGDEYSQRIESDEDTVEITTIHGSKGLEYDIVVAPFLQLSDSNRHSTCQFYEGDTYYVAQKKLVEGSVQKTLYQTQADQENCRLLYVAVTRAKYHCYILTSNIEIENDTLSFHMIPLVKANGKLDEIRFFSDINDKLDFVNQLNLDEDAPEHTEFEESAPPPSQDFRDDRDIDPIPRIHLPDHDWQKTSYSGLKKESGRVIKDMLVAPVMTDYDHFTFETLPKGAQAGDFLHDIFERIDFSDTDTWEPVVRQMIRRYQIQKDDPEFISNMIRLIDTVVDTGLHTESSVIHLRDIRKDQRLSEFEFDIPMTRFSTASVPEVVDENIPLGIKDISTLSGILNGKIDLVFLHEGKYYILDWKSNFLGNHTGAYERPLLCKAMQENHFYLQYYVYGMAFRRYLTSRIPSFDFDTQFGGVFYLFFRGMRTGAQTGVYFHRPSSAVIEELSGVMFT
jgi:exodeoxyribonuclease V beta subunit